MKQSIFQEKNLKTPEEIFNVLGNQEFKGEWSDIPLQILQQHPNVRHLSENKRGRNRYMAEQVYKKFCKFVKGNDVTIYTTKEAFDSPSENREIVMFKNQKRFRISKSDFFLIEEDVITNDKGEFEGFMDQARRNFWVEMPNETNPMSFKKPGRKDVFNKQYIRSIFPDVAKAIEGKITHENCAYALKIFLKERNEAAPKSSWVGNNLGDEIKEENIKRGHA